ncbi:hypothetical protein HDU86_006445 [Geranomyces michiganensis]|nr:hypothetical protein HDU86_006445 [Geranomyces michiganensis]
MSGTWVQSVESKEPKAQSRPAAPPSGGDSCKGVLALSLLFPSHHHPPMPHRSHAHSSAMPLLFPSARPTSLVSRASPLAPLYLLDYGTTLLVMVLSVFLDNVPEPFHRDFRLDDPRISHPYRSETVPSWMGWIIAFGGAAAIVLTSCAVRAWRMSRGHNYTEDWKTVMGWDMHHAALGTILAVALTQFLTNVLKLMIGVLRPDFLARCQPSLLEPQTCTNTNASMIRDGRMSFPSGHSGRVAAGLGFAMWYLIAATGAAVMDQRRPEGRVWKLLVCVIPLLMIAAMATNRLQRNRHHVPDVCVGAALGLAISFICYRYYYPSITSCKAGEPKIGPVADDEDGREANARGSTNDSD